MAREGLYVFTFYDELTMMMMCFLGAENETDTQRGQSNTSLVWVVVLLLTSGATITSLGVFFCCCCHWQRRRRCDVMVCCDVIARRGDVTGGTAASRDILQSLVHAPPLRKRILFMRNNILYASGTVPTAKVCLSFRPSVCKLKMCVGMGIKTLEWEHVKFHML